MTKGEHVMSGINEFIKDVFGDVPASFSDAVQSTLDSITNDDSAEQTPENDGLQVKLVEAFSAVKASEGTVEAVIQKANQVE